MMKRFQPRLKREARPQRHGGEEADWRLQIKNERVADCGGGRDESLASRGQQQRHRNTFWLGQGRTLKLFCKGNSKDLLTVCWTQNAN